METPDTAQSQNIYQMYESNGNKAGFFVRRNGWSTVYAQVKSIGGMTDGPLEGKPPYYGNPRVTMDVFNNNGTLQKANQSLACAGTYTYKIHALKTRKK